MKLSKLNNRYEIRNIIGTGGMAIVYDAYDTILSRPVAIKVLKENFVENETIVNRLRTEAQTSAAINDDNIVAIYDVGHAEINDKNIEYIVMEKVEGSTLKDVIQSESPLSEDKILDYSLQIAKALQTAHRQGLVHRDIKPANILITNNGKIKVTDFGIARVSSDATLTYTSSILGTVHYISPEQAKGQPLDERSDLYSLGVVLYELATGIVPFDGESPVSIAVKHIQEEPQNIIELNPKLSENFITVIEKLLSKDPENRYKTASNLIIDINRILNGVKLETQPVKKSVSTDTVKQKVSYNKRTNSDSSKVIDTRKRPILKITSIIAFLLILLTGVYFASNYFTSISQKQNIVIMPSVVNVDEQTATQRLEELGLYVQIKERKFDNEIISGNVIEQSVGSQREVKKGTTVDLVISKGRELVRVPNIKGFDLLNIEQTVKNARLDIGEQITEDSDLPKGQIIKQLPSAGEMVEIGTKINIVLSNGPKEENISVPSVIGISQTEALSTLRSEGLIPSQISTEYSSVVPENNVISQSINPGSSVPKGTKISIVISIGKEPEPIPETTPETPSENNTDSSSQQNQPTNPVENPSSNTTPNPSNNTTPNPTDANTNQTP